MAINLKNYEPALMAGANIEVSLADVTIDDLAVGDDATIGGDLTVTGTTTTGTQVITGAVSLTGSLSATGTATVLSGTAVPASAGAVAAGKPVTLFSSGPSIYVTSDAPAFSAVKGSLCINVAGDGVGNRLYINNGTTNWVAITTAS